MNWLKKWLLEKFRKWFNREIDDLETPPNVPPIAPETPTPHDSDAPQEPGRWKHPYENEGKL